MTVAARLAVATAAALLAFAAAPAVARGQAALLPPLPADALRLKLAAVYADYYATPIDGVERLVRAGIPDDDVSVICLVAATTTAPTSTLALMRLQKLSWAEIFERVRMPGRALVPVTKGARPGGRFSAPLAVIAADQERPPDLGDDQVRDLVQLKVAVEHFGLEPSLVAAWRDQGTTNARILLAQLFAGGGKTTGRKLQIAAGGP